VEDIWINVATLEDEMSVEEIDQDAAQEIIIIIIIILFV